MSRASSAATGVQDSSSDAAVLQWRVHLLRSDFARIPVVLLSTVFATGVAWSLFHNPLFCAAALLMLSSATSEYLLPSSLRLTAHDAEHRSGINRFYIQWDKVKRVMLYGDGIRLSPLPTASRLDAFRGVYLRFGPDGAPGDRASVLEAISRLRPYSGGSEGRY